MSRKKWGRFYPVPGGTDDILQNLMAMWTYVRQASPSRPEFADWLVRVFPQVGNPEKHVTHLVRMRLVSEEGEWIRLPSEARRYLASGEPSHLLDLFERGLKGFYDLLGGTAETPRSLKELRYYNRKAMERKSEDRQEEEISRRLAVLRSLGYLSVDPDGGTYLATSYGRALARQGAVASVEESA